MIVRPVMPQMHQIFAAWKSSNTDIATLTMLSVLYRYRMVDIDRIINPNFLRRIRVSGLPRLVFNGNSVQASWLA